MALVRKLNIKKESITLKVSPDTAARFTAAQEQLSRLNLAVDDDAALELLIRALAKVYSKHVQVQG